MSLKELTVLVNQIGQTYNPRFKAYSMRLPESLQKLDKLPTAKITEIQESNTFRASNKLVSAAQKFQVQLYLSTDKDIDELETLLKLELEKQGYYSGYSGGYPHPDYKTVYVKTIQFTKTKFYV